MGISQTFSGLQFVSRRCCCAGQTAAGWVWTQQVLHEQALKLCPECSSLCPDDFCFPACRCLAGLPSLCCPAYTHAKMAKTFKQALAQNVQSTDDSWISWLGTVSQWSPITSAVHDRQPTCYLCL